MECEASTIKFQSLKCHCILDISVCGFSLLIFYFLLNFMKLLSHLENKSLKGSNQGIIAPKYIIDSVLMLSQCFSIAVINMRRFSYLYNQFTLQYHTLITVRKLGKMDYHHEYQQKVQIGNAK